MNSDFHHLAHRRETVRFTHKVTKLCNFYSKKKADTLRTYKYSTYPNHDKYESIVRKDAVDYFIETQKTNILTDVAVADLDDIACNFIIPNQHGQRRQLQIVEGPEEKARFLLKRMIGESAFRSYLKNGFLTYRAESGLTYQIFPGYGMSHVWNNGEPVEKLCLVFQDRDIPPTDSVIMRLLMLEHNEEEFKRLAVSWEFSRAVSA